MFKKAASFILLLLALSTTKTFAAEYNFYFNGTEQGDNSQANPSVSVNGKPVNPPKEETSASDDKTNSSTAKDVAKKVEPVVPYQPKPPKGRVALNMTSLGISIPVSDPFWSSGYLTAGGLSLSGTYNFTDAWGLTFALGQLSARDTGAPHWSEASKLVRIYQVIAETDFTVYRGALTNELSFEGAGLLGYSYAKEERGELHNANNIHLGIRTGFSLREHPSFMLNIAYRLLFPTTQSSSKSAIKVSDMGELGLAMVF